MRLALLAVFPFLIAADWPQHLGPNRDGHAADERLAKAWPESGPTKAWSHPLGSGWAGPVVAGKHVFIFHRVGDQEVLECLAADTGKPIWKAGYAAKYADDFNFDDGPRACPLVQAGTVYTLGADGELAAWSASDGKSLWRINLLKTYGTPKGFFGMATSPILVAGKLLVNVGAARASVVAFDPSTGKEAWKAGEDGVSYSSPTLATIEGESLAVFFTREGLLTVVPETGAIRHQHPWRPRLNASVNAATPVVKDNRILLTTSYGTGAILLESKKGMLESLWEGDRSVSAHYNTPILIGDHLYGIDGRQEGGQAKLVCVEWLTGKAKWTQAKFGCAGLIHADGLVVAVRESGEVTMFRPSPDKFEEIATAAVASLPVRALPALAGGRLFLRDSKRLLAFEVGRK